VSVYFPCYVKSCEYKAALAECLSDIEEILSDGYDVIIAVDTNFECDAGNDGFEQLNNLLMAYHINHCDNFVIDSTHKAVTYANEALGHCSFIDHVFVSDTVRKSITSGVICDLGSNNSDHIPLVYTFLFTPKISSAKHDMSHVRPKYHS